MKRWVFLSHVLSAETPGYGGEAGFQSENVKCMSKGDSCNSMRWRLSNHIGTHIDAPFHFSESGARIDDFQAESWVFRRPHIVDRPAAPGDLVGLEGEAWCQTVPEDADLLLLRTGFEKCRGEAEYWSLNPGLAPELGDFLRATRPNLRAIGVDFISATSYLHRPIGRLAHKSFLDPNRPGSPLLIIEDMALSALDVLPQMVVVAPLRVMGADGSPVTVLAEC